MRQHHRQVAPLQASHAREMRKEPTLAERRLWRLLRDRRLGGLKFRRQVALGAYIVDFVCFERRVAIEADGDQHAESRHDQVRDAWLQAKGFSIWRFWNADILRDPESIGATIAHRLGLPW
jgi:very-short-patch-repair endonuclease